MQFSLHQIIHLRHPPEPPWPMAPWPHGPMAPWLETTPIQKLYDRTDDLDSSAMLPGITQIISPRNPAKFPKMSTLKYVRHLRFVARRPLCYSLRALAQQGSQVAATGCNHKKLQLVVDATIIVDIDYRE